MFGLVVGVLVLEAALRLASLVIERRSGDASATANATGTPILAVGDGDAAWSAELGVNLRIIVACVRHAGGRPVLLT